LTGLLALQDARITQPPPLADRGRMQPLTAQIRPRVPVRQSLLIGLDMGELLRRGEPSPLRATGPGTSPGVVLLTVLVHQLQRDRHHHRIVPSLTLRVILAMRCWPQLTLTRRDLPADERGMIRTCGWLSAG